MQGIAQLGGLIGGYLLAAGLLKLFISTYWTICILFDISLVYIWFCFFYSGDIRNEAAAGMYDFESFHPADGGAVSDVVSFDLNNNNNNDDGDDGDVGGGDGDDDDIDEEAGDFRGVQNGRRNRNGNDRLEEVDDDGLSEYENQFYGASDGNNGGSARRLVHSSSGGGSGGGSGGAGSSSWSSFIGRRQTFCIIYEHF